MGKSMTLKEWLDRTGSADAAKLLKVEQATIRNWRHGLCLPRAEQMAAIRKYSKGAVTYESMVEAHLKTLKSRARA